MLLLPGKIYADKRSIWACPCGPGFPLQVLALRCGLSAAIPHAAKRKLIAQPASTRKIKKPPVKKASDN